MDCFIVPFVNRFEKQQELMLKVCSELEPEQESDSEDVKRKRFEVVLDLMQKVGYSTTAKLFQGYCFS